MVPDAAASYLPLVRTGLQMLCIVAAGRLAAWRRIFDAASTCRTLNRFVVSICLPALQFWLLAIKTDMRNMEHWRAIGAFMIWTLLVQLGCAVWVVLMEGGNLARVGVHSLVLVANNTGILAPVVLEAAVGPSAAAIGMLATVALYFQQLPTAMVLFELDRVHAQEEEEEQQQYDQEHGLASSKGAVGAAAAGGGAAADSAAERPKGGDSVEPLTPAPTQPGEGASGGGDAWERRDLPRPPTWTGAGGEEGLAAEAGVLQSRWGDSDAAAVVAGGRDDATPGLAAREGRQGSARLRGSSGALAQASVGSRLCDLGPAGNDDASSLRQASPYAAAAALAATILDPAPALDGYKGGASADAPLIARAASSAQQLLNGGGRHALSHAASLPVPLLSTQRSQRQLSSCLLSPPITPRPSARSPSWPALPEASSVEHGLRHAARLVLSNTLVWTTGAATAASMLGLHTVLDPAVPSHIPQLDFVEGTLAWLARCSVPVSLFAMGLWVASRPPRAMWGSTAAYLAIKLLLLPGLMVFVNSLLGLSGQLGRSLVVLTCVPVGQMAFVVAEQYDAGAEAVTGVMQVGLLLMLPHVLGVIAVLRWLGIYEDA